MANTCKYCKRTFPSSKALSQHTRSKHFKNSIGPYVALVVVIGIGIAIAAFMMTGSSSGSSIPQSEPSILERTLTSHDSLVQHIHANLMISVDGKVVDVPANIGVSGNAFRYMHTHDDSGRIHIESPSTHQFTLSDFFTIWDKEFSSECVDNNCGDVVVKVNGNIIDSPSTYVLQDEDEVLIEVSTQA